MNMSLILPLGLTAAAGALLAARTQPACHWSSLGAIVLKTRLAMLKASAPSRRRARLAVLGLAGLICAGALTAYAAEPSAPERLAAQAAGVVGSGDQLALRLVQNQQERTLKPGEDYADGWKLEALTPTVATLVKDGERRQVGLNPTGAVAAAQPAAPPSQVQLALSDAELLEKAIKGGLWDGKTPRPGLTLAETQRYYVLTTRAMDVSIRYSMEVNQRSVAAGLGALTVRVGDERVYSAALGPTEGAEYIALMREERTNKLGLAQALYDKYGPVEVTMPLAYDKAAYAKRDADYPGASWTFKPGVDPTTHIAVLTPPNPNAGTLIPDTVPTMDEAALVGPPGRPQPSEMMPASQWLARATPQAPAP